jgi:hypothetical protein
MSILASTDKHKSKRQLTRLPRLNPIAMRLSVICCQPSATLFAIRHSLPSIERKDEILEAHRSGISIHRIAQIFREPNVDISTQDLMRAIRLFIEEGEGTKGKTSVAEATGTSEKTAQKPVTYRFLNRLLLLFGRRNLRSSSASRRTPVTGGQLCVLLLTGKESGNRRFLPLTNPGSGCLNFLVPDLAGRGLVWFFVEL